MKVASSAHFNLCPVSGGFFLGLLLDSEDGGDMVFRNIRLSWSYTVLQPRRYTLFMVTAARTTYPNMALLFTIFSWLQLIYM
jgi:hypothetical protein